MSLNEAFGGSFWSIYSDCMAWRIGMWICMKCMRKIEHLHAYEIIYTADVTDLHHTVWTSYRPLIECT